MTCTYLGSIILGLSQFKKVDTLITQWNKFVPFVLDFHDTVIDSSKADTALKIKQYYLKNKKNVDYYELAKVGIGRYRTIFYNAVSTQTFQ